MRTGEQNGCSDCPQGQVGRVCSAQSLCPLSLLVPEPNCVPLEAKDKDEIRGWRRVPSKDGYNCIKLFSPLFSIPNSSKGLQNLLSEKLHTLWIIFPLFYLFVLAKMLFCKVLPQRITGSLGVAYHSQLCMTR